ncbi:Hypothetical protein BQ3484_145 [Cedratvirus A11]|uniref:Uncharacterized protein n=1 Tax=Cedratvirus A11 TaxID=1903266 RepID=A0A1M7XU49_9VIRU|nr:Hypothetical protein BQ3484_145 [Cedratvirus A11]SHO33213.1 Hypothetical protein BQ3484_145 [Cedratvirus A11]
MYRELYIESQEWIYISSREEEKIIGIAEEKRKQEKREISSLTRTGFLAQKRAIKSRISALALSERVQTSRLDGSLRSRCIRDALSICLPAWKRDVSFLLAREHVLSCIRGERKPLPVLRWNELKSEKNLFCEMSSFAFSASNPAEKNGLDRNILSDMVWSVQMCLCKNLSLCMERALILPELEIIEACIFSLLEPLLFFWDRTSTNVSNKTINNLPDVWRREEEERKKNTLIDASYTGQANDSIKLLLEEGKIPRGYLVDINVLEERKAFLEKSLKFKT